MGKQSILNAAARLIGGIQKFALISGFIRDLFHWLPIQQRIQFKTFPYAQLPLCGGPDLPEVFLYSQESQPYGCFEFALC